MLPLELLDAADLLLASNGGNPSDAAIRRAISSIYYALFHFICGECADRMIGATTPCRRQRAWRQVYRALDHRPAKNRCKQIGQESNVLDFPRAIRNLATLLVSLQEKRHEADYDPTANLTLLDAATYSEGVREAIRQFKRASKKHRRAFAAYLLVNQRERERG